MVGSNARLFCTAHAMNIFWHARFPNGSEIRIGSDGVILGQNQRLEGGVINATLTVNAMQRLNNTLLYCVAIRGSGPVRSSNATLIIYTSLRKSILIVHSWLIYSRHAL